MEIEEQPSQLTPKELEIAAQGFRRIAQDPLLPSVTTLLAARLVAEAITQEEIRKQADKGLSTTQVRIMRRFTSLNKESLPDNPDQVQFFHSFLDQQEAFATTREEQGPVREISSQREIAKREQGVPDISPIFRAAMKNPTLAAKHAGLYSMEVAANIGPWFLWTSFSPFIFFSLDQSFASYVPKDLWGIIISAELLSYLFVPIKTAEYYMPRVNQLADKIRQKLQPLVETQSIPIPNAAIE